MNTKIILAALTLGAALALGGCTENGGPPASAQSSLGKPHAECLVCKHENDLACVDIEVDDKTPRATIDGKEYFFCSDDCKTKCQRDPKKFLNAK